MTIRGWYGVYFRLLDGEVILEAVFQTRDEADKHITKNFVDNLLCTDFWRQYFVRRVEVRY